MTVRTMDTIVRKFREYAPFVTLIAVTFALRSAVADWNDIPSGSMEPTLIIGDRIVVNKLAYNLRIPFTMATVARWDTPKRGEIVVFISPADGRRLVKRVVGVPGDTIEMRNERIVINGETVALSPLDAGRFEKLVGDDSNRRYYRETLAGKEHVMAILPDHPALRTFAPVTIPDRQYLVLGDNRDNSADSRYIGFIDEWRIVGKVTGIAFSLNHDRWFFPRSDRFFIGPDRVLHD